MAVPGVAASRTHCFNDQKKMNVIPVPDPVDPPPSLVNHMGTHPPPPPPLLTPQRGPEDDTMAVPSVLTPITHCSYTKGRCDRHGEAAKLKWKPDGVKTTKDGKKTLKKLYYYTCEENKKKPGRTIQQKLTFPVKKPSNNVETAEDDKEDTM